MQPVKIWGDYGDLLVSGYAHRDRAKRLLVKRAGPFVPPISLPKDENRPNKYIVLSDEFKRRLENGPLPRLAKLSFREAIKDFIVAMNWHEWDREAPPRKTPFSGEPEDYFVEYGHDPQVAARMPKLWELVIPIARLEVKFVFEQGAGDYRDRYIVKQTGPEHSGLFWAGEPYLFLFVDQAAKKWIQAEAGDWVSFTKAEVA